MIPTTRLVLLAADPGARIPCLLLDAQGRILEKALCVPGNATALTPAGRTVVAVPGQHVRTRRVHLPLRHPAQARAALLLQLDGELASNGAPHIALGPVDADGYRLACIVEPEAMRAWLGQLAALGIAADVLLPDHLLLPAPTDERATVASLRDHRVIVRAPTIMFSADKALAANLLASQPQHPHVVGDDALALLASGTVQPLVDLQQGDFAQRRSDDAGARQTRRIRWLAGLVLASPLVLVAADALRHEISAKLLQQRTQTSAATAVGRSLEHSEAVTAVDAQLARLRGSSGFNGLTNALMHAVQAQPSVRIERLEYTEGILGVTLAHEDKNAAARVTDALLASGVSASLDVAGTDAARSTLSLEAAQ